MPLKKKKLLEVKQSGWPIPVISCTLTLYGTFPGVVALVTGVIVGPTSRAPGEEGKELWEKVLEEQYLPPHGGATQTPPWGVVSKSPGPVATREYGCGALTGTEEPRTMTVKVSAPGALITMCSTLLIVSGTWLTAVALPEQSKGGETWGAWQLLP